MEFRNFYEKKITLNGLYRSQTPDNAGILTSLKASIIFKCESKKYFEIILTLTNVFFFFLFLQLHRIYFPSWYVHVGVRAMVFYKIIIIIYCLKIYSTFYKKNIYVCLSTILRIVNWCLYNFNFYICFLYYSNKMLFITFDGNVTSVLYNADYKISVIKCGDERK